MTYFIKIGIIYYATAVFTTDRGYFFSIKLVS